MTRFQGPSQNWNDSTSDEELVAWVKRGQIEAFGLLYDRYLQRVYGYCFRMLGAKEAAEDVNSLVFSKALAGVAGFRENSTPGTFRRWLFAIAHNAISNELRSRRDFAPLDDVYGLTAGSMTPEEHAIAADRRKTVMDLLPQLSADQSQVVALLLAGLTAVEIGELMGRPRNAIDGIHHRARIRLQDLVATGSEPPLRRGGGHA